MKREICRQALDWNLQESMTLKDNNIAEGPNLKRKK